MKMSREETLAAMRSAGVGAPAIARWEQQNPEIQRTNYVHVCPDELRFPIRITLPWSFLVSDNDRERPIMRMMKGTPRPAIAMTSHFRAVRVRVQALAKEVMQGFPPLTQPLSLVGRLYTPTQRRVDVTNFAKAVQDSLSKIVYVDDQQLQDVRWVKVEMDMDRPRAEIEIAPL